MKRFLSNSSDPIFWLACHVFGIALPLIAISIVLTAMTLSFSISAVTNGGQFALYSVAMLVTTLYILLKGSQRRLPYSRWLGLMFSLLLFLSAAFFVVAVLFQSGLNMAHWIIEWPTIGLFGISLIVTFVAVVADNRRMIDLTQLGRSREASLDSLNRDFDKQF